MFINISPYSHLLAVGGEGWESRAANVSDSEILGVTGRRRRPLVANFSIRPPTTPLLL